MIIIQINSIIKIIVQTIYDIVKAHGGELTVKSEVSKGTEFTVFIPHNG